MARKTRTSKRNMRGGFWPFTSSTPTVPQMGQMPQTPQQQLMNMKKDDYSRLCGMTGTGDSQTCTAKLNELKGMGCQSSMFGGITCPPNPILQPSTQYSTPMGQQIMPQIIPQTGQPPYMPQTVPQMGQPYGTQMRQQQPASQGFFGMKRGGGRRKKTVKRRRHRKSNKKQH